MKSHEIPAISPRFQLFLDPTVPSSSRLLALGTYCLGLSQTATTLTLPGARLWHMLDSNVALEHTSFTDDFFQWNLHIGDFPASHIWLLEGREIYWMPTVTHTFRSFPASRGSPTGPVPLGAKSQVDLPLIPVTARSDWCQGFEHLTCLQRLDLVECRFVNDEACETLGPGKGRDPGWKKQGLAPRFLVKIS